MVRSCKNFSDSDLKTIEATIKEVEQTTSGEIVVQLSPFSGAYRTAYWLFGTLGWIIASVAALTLPLSLTVFFEWQIAGLLFGAAFGFIPGLARWTSSKGRQAYLVHRAALATFAERGVHRTREQTGVLIYLSELEHRVEILADSGIHAKVSADFWKEKSDKIALGFKERHPTENLCQTIREIGAVLASHFPPRSDNPNELSNTVLTSP